MVTSNLIQLQKDVILSTVKRTYPEGSWRYVIADAEALALIDRVVPRDEIINQNVAGVETLEHKRTPHPDMEAVYFLTPKLHILECLLSEFKRPRPRHIGGHLVWTSSPSEKIKDRLAKQATRGKNWVMSERILPINFNPMESNVFTFQDPKSFYPLYNPKCDALAQGEFAGIAQKILGVCVALDEFPIIRYFMSPNLEHRAQQLPRMIAMALQRELEGYQKYMQAQGRPWPPQEDKSRPRGVLFVVDRSMDPVAPLLHEFTYQAMAHDLLPIKEENGKFSYSPDPKDPKEMVLADSDEVWTKMRHKHMTDTIREVREDLDKFIKAHPQFQTEQGQTSVFDLKSMLASLPQFSAMKDAYELHLTMAGECMGIFQRNGLADTADLEQTLATGIDGAGEKPKNVTELLIQLLDAPNTQNNNDRLRLIMLYLLWRDGLVGPDIEKLFRHSKVMGGSKSALYNLDLIGARIVKNLKDPNRPGYKTNPPARPILIPEGTELSRYVPEVKKMLEEHNRGTLDMNTYPFTDQQAAQEAAQQAGIAGPQASLRTAKPTWTKQRSGNVESKQRVIVFVAGGATYSEARSCYEVGNASQKDIYLGTSHMVSPNQWLEHLSSAREDRSLLDLPADQPPGKAPPHLFEPDPDPNANKPPAKPTSNTSSSSSVPQASGSGRGTPAPAPQGKAPQGRPAPQQSQSHGHFGRHGRK
ncbi:hypothetical protein H072_10488 [Dactylellina haptotyla CBS 200.50]|uniref:Sec1-like protein n=1 Tax=Dactylellina haptotyla (strain CBS 200.50) TaxID=1284197 RepID=S8BL96_DACHA|nr:hypothetical protein H072_10488 [Dactylellina haptotyla CBS 200.50]